MMKLNLLLPMLLLFVGLTGCNHPEEDMLDLMEAIATTAETGTSDCNAQASALKMLLEENAGEIVKARSVRAQASAEERKALEKKFGTRRHELAERTIRALRPCATEPSLASALRRL